MTDAMEMQIAAMGLKGKFPADGPLIDRIKGAMRAVRTANEHEVFWMSGRAVNDDIRFRTALAAVMLEGSEEDRAEITRSMKPLRALSAAASGIPIDVEALLAETHDAIPLMKLWHETAEKT